MTEPGRVCVLCPILNPDRRPQPPLRPPACEACRIQLNADLAELPKRYATLTLWLEPGRTGGARARGFESRPPVMIAPLSLLGPGTMTPLHRDYQIGDPPPLITLAWWAADWAIRRGMREHPPTRTATVTDLTRWLRHRLAWAVDNHPSIHGFTRDTRNALRAVRAVADGEHHRPGYAGTCPRPVHRGDTITTCGVLLTVDLAGQTISCPNCGTVWHQRTGGWIDLRAAQRLLEPSGGPRVGEAANVADVDSAAAAGENNGG